MGTINVTVRLFWSDQLNYRLKLFALSGSRSTRSTCIKSTLGKSQNHRSQVEIMIFFSFSPTDTKNTYYFQNCCRSTLKDTNNRTRCATEIWGNAVRPGGKTTTWVHAIQVSRWLFVETVLFAHAIVSKNTVGPLVKPFYRPIDSARRINYNLRFRRCTIRTRWMR